MLRLVAFPTSEKKKKEEEEEEEESNLITHAINNIKRKKIKHLSYLKLLNNVNSLKLFVHIPNYINFNNIHFLRIDFQI